MEIKSNLNVSICPLRILSVELVLSELFMSLALDLVCSAVGPLGKLLRVPSAP